MLKCTFRMFEHPKACNEVCSIKIMQAACPLNNVIRIPEGNLYKPRRFALFDTVPVVIGVISENNNNTFSSQAAHIRDELHNYFLQP